MALAHPRACHLALRFEVLAAIAFAHGQKYSLFFRGGFVLAVQDSLLLVGELRLREAQQVLAGLAVEAELEDLEAVRVDSDDLDAALLVHLGRQPERRHEIRDHLEVEKDDEEVDDVAADLHDLPIHVLLRPHERLQLSLIHI